ncbi:hypothetical protein THASP1DRAFT_17623 [Thamnocephalis sphaerospora]|uniref:PAP-associated domain-containing protein n=1 Tax=Thamnocephalis sphaerospora TaxID=78915 RepID=A0A4P9XMB7_9FUNG|nr:hypothetical protein THASP1DRAFT_17623 [Thamnocephalis sphaerospora]|eukprot:RKP07057.1 hypothetical protein THASP1DRAFT_17623 [Thamnocephalis sphaerospora]
MRLRGNNSGQECDISFANLVALRNTRLFQTYTMADQRVRPLLFAVKRWSKMRAISNASQDGGTLNSYTHVLMMLAYLQRQRVIPPLQRICCGKHPQETLRASSAVADYTQVSPSPNTMSTGQLLVGFFRYYAFEFNYAEECVSVRLGGTLSRSAKSWPDQPGSSMRCADGQPAALCVEDPFVLERNCAVSAIRRSVAGIRWEYERALRALLSNRGLEGACLPWQEWPNKYYADLGVYDGSIEI